MNIWSGDLSLPPDELPLHDHCDESSSLKDLNLFLDHPYAAGDTDFIIPHDAGLEFLSCVAPSLLPLHRIVGPSLRVWTEDKRTEDWFADSFSCHAFGCGGGEPDGPWSVRRLDQCPVGVLARVKYSKEGKRNRGTASEAYHGKTEGRARITEVLFYASYFRARLDQATESEDDGYAHSPELHVYALPFLSDPLYPLRDSSPSLNCEDTEQHLRPLPPPTPDPEPQAIAEDTNKKQRVTHVFEEAEKRRKRAKRNGGKSVAQAASGSPVLNGRAACLKSASDKLKNAGCSAHTPQPNSRASSESIRNSRESLQARRKGMSEAQPNSMLSRRQSVSTHNPKDPVPATIEMMNKDALSRVVMTGMRLYGLQSHKKNLKHQRDSVLSELLVDGNDERAAAGHALMQEEMGDVEADRWDEEFKLIYHQTFKSAAFALRNDIKSALVQPDLLRDTVDQLLAIFCNADTTFLRADDPLDAITNNSGRVTRIGDDGHR